MGGIALINASFAYTYAHCNGLTSLKEITQMLNHFLFSLMGRFDMMDLSYHR